MFKNIGFPEFSCPTGNFELNIYNKQDINNVTTEPKFDYKRLRREYYEGNIPVISPTRTKSMEFTQIENSVLKKSKISITFKIDKNVYNNSTITLNFNSTYYTIPDDNASTCSEVTKQYVNVENCKFKNNIYTIENYKAILIDEKKIIEIEHIILP
jgi:hypothetical protein